MVRLTQEAVANPPPQPDLHVIPVFKLRLAMDVAEEMMGEATPRTDVGCLFCLSYHLKGV